MILIGLALSFAQLELPPLGLEEEGDSFPAIRSEEALALEQRFRDWSRSVSNEFGSPLSLNYEVTLTFDVSTEEEEYELVFSGTYRAEVRSLHEMRHHLAGRISMDKTGDASVPVELELLLDGDNVWFYFQAEGVAGIPENGFLMRAKQKPLEELYAETLVALSKIDTSLDLEGFEWAVIYPQAKEMMPPDLGTLLHPQGFLHFCFRLLATREMETADGRVATFAIVDQQHGSLIRNFRDGLLQKARAEKWLAPSSEPGMAILKEVFSGLYFETVFDESTGELVQMDVGMIAFFDDILDLGIASETMVLMSAEVKGSTTPLAESGTDSFSAPGQSAVAFDASPFLQMALNAVRESLADLESNEDFAF